MRLPIYFRFLHACALRPSSLPICHLARRFAFFYAFCVSFHDYGNFFTNNTIINVAAWLGSEDNDDDEEDQVSTNPLQKTSC